MMTRQHTSHGNSARMIGRLYLIGVVYLTGVVLLASGCTSESGVPEVVPTTSKKPQVYTVNYPLAYFAERIGGDLIDVTFPAPADANPADWNPDAAAIAAYQSADLILLNGAGYAAWIQRATLPMSRTVVTTRDIEDRLIAMTQSVTHQHGPEGSQSDVPVAAQTWLDPQLAIAQALVIRDELAKLLPTERERLDESFRLLESDLMTLDEELRAAFAATTDSALLASKPVYDYLQRRYSLSLTNLQWHPQQSPTDVQWVELQAVAKEHPASLMLWEEEPTDETAARLQSMSIHPVVFDTVSNRPASGDYLQAMRANASRILQAAGTPSTDSTP